MTTNDAARVSGTPQPACSGTVKQTIYAHGGSRIWMESDDGRRDLLADTYDSDQLAKKVRDTIEAHFFPNATDQQRPGPTAPASAEFDLLGGEAPSEANGIRRTGRALRPPSKSVTVAAPAAGGA